MKISLQRCLGWLALGVALYVGMQYLQVYFYASEFDDFVKDEVKFAPARESTDQDVRTHIAEAATQYGMIVDPSNIRVDVMPDSQRGIRRLEVSVTYTAELGLHFRNYPLHFRTYAVGIY